MSTKSRNECLFDKCSSKIEPELMKCGQVFLSIISEDFVFFCDFCKNTTSKYTIFDELANHIKETHVMVWSKNDEPCSYAEEQEQDNGSNILKKESAEELALLEFEISYLNPEEDVISDSESLNEPLELSPDDDYSCQAILEPRVFLLQWPESQVIQFINLYRDKESLWNVESKLYHKNKVKDDAYQDIMNKFNELHPNALKDITSVKNAVKELQDFVNLFDKEQQQPTGVSSTHYEINKTLLFLKNISNSTPVQLPKTAIDCCNYFQKKSTKSKNLHNSEITKDSNKLSIDRLPSDCKICPICRVNFENSEELKIHLSDRSSCLRKNICDGCGAKFEDRSKFIIHLRRHKNDKLPYLCENCGLRYRYPKQLETHKLLHGEPLFECNDCDMKFLLKRHLVYHQRSKHGPKEMMVCCDICKNMYRNKDSLLRHERKIHNIRKRASMNLI